MDICVGEVCGLYVSCIWIEEGSNALMSAYKDVEEMVFDRRTLLGGKENINHADHSFSVYQYCSLLPKYISLKSANDDGLMQVVVQFLNSKFTNIGANI